MEEEIEREKEWRVCVCGELYGHRLWHELLRLILLKGQREKIREGKDDHLTSSQSKKKIK